MGIKKEFQPLLIEVERVPETNPEQAMEDMATLAQAEQEGVDLNKNPDGTLARTITFMEREFPISSAVGLMPLLQFSFHAKKGAGAADMESMAAMYTMIQDCIHEDHWEEFQEHAVTSKANEDDLLTVVGQVIELLSARPTERASGSPSTSPTASGSLTDTSSGQRAHLVPVSELASSA